MAGSLNKAMLIGNLGNDPEVRSFQNGGQVCNLSVATSETWKDRNTGERKERTEWHRVAIFAEHAVNYVQRYAKKGTKIYVEGKLETRKWQDQSGNDRYSTEITVKPFSGDVKILSGGAEGGNQGGYGGSNQGGYGNGGGSGGYSGGSGQGGGYSGGGGYADDDEIPF